MAESPAPDQRAKIFISHRHADTDAAKVVADRLDTIGGVDIFLSSHPDFEGPRIGQPIGESLKDVLGTTSLVILIFSTADADWSWCMWECGVATNPNDEVPTNVVTISLSGESPKVYGQHLGVKAADLKSVTTFVDQFCTAKGFFPDLNRPLTDRSSGDRFIGEQAQAIFDALAPFTSQVEDHPRWGGFRVTVEPGVIEKLKPLDEPPTGALVDEIMAGATVSDPSGWGLEHFGYSLTDQSLTLADLRVRWETERGDSRVTNRPWNQLLAEEFWRIATSRRTNLTWDPFLSVKEGAENLWVYPIVYRFRSFSGERYEYDLLVIQTRAPEASQ